MARTPPFPANPEVLRWARRLAGWDVEALAKRLNVKPEVVMAWEAGDTQPSLAKARQLADLYRRPVAMFMLAEPPVDDVPTVADFRGVDELDLGREIRRELHRAERRRAVMLRLTEPPVFSLASVELDDDIVEAAETTRQILGVSVGDQIGASTAYAALRLLTEAVTDAGVLVFTMSRVDTAACRGFSIHYDRYPVIMLNGGDPPQARCFTLFHELGHLLQRTSGICTLFGPSVAETRSNRFAAEMLMPRTEFLALLGDQNPLDALPALAYRFNVSREAAAVRLRVLGRISQEALSTVRSDTAARWEEGRAEQRDRPGGPPHYRTQLRNLGEQYVTTVINAREAQRITEVEAAHFLESKLSTIDQMESELVKRGPTA